MTCMALSKYYSIDGAFNELMVFMNHQPKSRANARFAYERGAQGKEIRVYSSKLIRTGQEVYVFFG
ncbi:hypothetical protein H2202_011157 [Exophiala xenobiotica]|nr:hypothetical protein H2202_011157 [Exophiala xenobiotica]